MLSSTRYYSEYGSETEHCESYGYLSPLATSQSGLTFPPWTIPSHPLKILGLKAEPPNSRQQVLARTPYRKWSSDRARSLTGCGASQRLVSQAFETAHAPIVVENEIVYHSCH